MRNKLYSAMTAKLAGKRTHPDVVSPPKSRVKFRKNFFPLIIVIGALWALVAGEVYFVDPKTPYAMPLFFLLVFLALFFSTATVFANSRRGFVSAVTLSLYVLLRYLGVGSIVNLLLLTAIAITLELYVAKR